MKLICAKNTKNEFVVHPNAFDNANKVNTYLTQEEFIYLQEKMVKNFDMNLT